MYYQAAQAGLSRFEALCLPLGLVLDQISVWLVCLGGGLRESSVTKRKISYRAIELRDSTLAEMSQAITNPMTLSFTDNDGTEQTADFFITLARPPASEVSGNTSYYTGFGFDAEEA